MKDDSEKAFDALLCVICFLILVVFSIRGCLSPEEDTEKEVPQETIVIE